MRNKWFVLHYTKGSVLRYRYENDLFISNDTIRYLKGKKCFIFESIIVAKEEKYNHLLSDVELVRYINGRSIYFQQDYLSMTKMNNIRIFMNKLIEEDIISADTLYNNYPNVIYDKYHNTDNK